MHAAALARPMGPSQRTCLDLLIQHGEWYPNCGWNLSSGNGATKKVLDSLVLRGDAEKAERADKAPSSTYVIPASLPKTNLSQQ